MVSCSVVSSLDANGSAAAELPVSAPLGREFGKYRLTRRLARGGMGEVYLARLVGELGFEKVLVIKTILPELAEKPRFIEMFAAEAKTAVALSHGNIVPAYELGRAADTFYIAMGYVDGPSVAQLLEVADGKGLEPDVAAALHIMRGVLAGLSYAHREEPGRPAVVHRDITPRNILIDRSGQVRIVDFGIAAPAQREVGVRAGSIGYMSPEQARGDAADPRADVFSVGCLLYELCTHRRAFPKEGIWTTPELSSIPDEVRGPLERALAIDPDERFKDASEFNAALRGAFTKYTATYDDATLARTLSELFPRGWGRDEDRDSNDSGERPALPGPSETYATRLTAVTGIDPAALDSPAQSIDSDQTDSMVASREPTGPHLGLEDPNERTARSAVSPERRESGVRISSLAVVLGALGIGVAAFAIGRTESWSTEPDAAAQVRGVKPQVPRPAATRTPVPAPTNSTEPPSEATATPTLQRRLELTPADATVEVDGERLGGASPFVLTLPAQDTVEVRIEAKGRKPKTLALSARDASDAPLEVALELALEPQPTKPKEPGELRVLAPTVAWAEVHVDGRKVGNTPTRRIALPAGRHRVEVRCVPDVCNPERTLYKQSVTIEAGKLTRVDAQ